MAFLEWRRFTFFDVQKNVDNGKIAECLQDTHITVSTSGNGHVILCDVTGWAHLITRTWDVTSFKAYELTVSLAQQLPHDPYLVTIGDDEAGVNPLIKVWDWSRRDRHGNPTCSRVSRAVPSHMRPTPATALAIHENKNLLAVGFQDGSVSLFRGDIARQRSGKMKTLPDSGTSPITGLAFKGNDKLFVVSRACVCVFWLSTERCVTLDSQGAPPGCSVLADQHRLTVAIDDAIYCYTSEGRGPCYALEGEKVKLSWFRSYLVIVTNDSGRAASTSSVSAPKMHHLTILDIQNKFIVYANTFQPIDAVITEWGSLYLLTKNKELIYLEEKDLQSKLWLLFKKNLYDVGIRIANVHHYDVEGLTEIYKQYGDHLYSKGDLKGAIEQYVKTIGWLETSYVIRKYLEPRHQESLIQYLEELHKKGYATEDHTTLLLTCYVKIDQHDQQGKLKEFINSKDKAIDFDVDVAIKVVRQVSVDDALSLAAIHKRHDWYLQLMVEDKKEYRRALQYIRELPFDDADQYVRKYGHRLIQHEPDETTQFLKLLCTDYRPHSTPLVDEGSLTGARRDPDRALPDDYIHMFLSNSERLIEFLEHMTASSFVCSKLVYNALIEHYIHVCNSRNSERFVEFIKCMTVSSFMCSRLVYNVLIEHYIHVWSVICVPVLCTDYRPHSTPLVDEGSLTGARRDPARALPDDYIHMFLSNSERLIEFLEHMTASSFVCSKLVYNALIEHYIHVWAKSEGKAKAEYEAKVMKVLQQPEADYDKDQTLVICQMLGFKPGVLFLYEENKLWRAQVALHMRSNDAEGALGVCRRRGPLCPRLWLDVLWWPPPASCLPELLHVIDREKLLSPILVIDCLASTPTYTLGDVRKYLMDVLKNENDVITREQELAEKYRSESENMKAQIQKIQHEPVTFQSSRCAACSRPLELPTVHFLCQHSFHRDCFSSYSESESECPACSPARRAPPQQRPEALHKRLHLDHDPYAVVSEYYGRGLFNKVTVVTGAESPAAPAPAPLPANAPAPAPAPAYGPGAEAKLRQQEGQSKQMYIATAPKQVPPMGTSVVPVPEGRMRLLEQQRYSCSLEANLNRLEPRQPPAHPKVETAEAAVAGSPKISSAIANENKNPFEEDTYDEAKNPFADDEPADPTNPFADDDDYDKNLNPFS